VGWGRTRTGEPVDHSQSGGHSDSRDDEWDSRVERAATADVRDLLRTARRRRRERVVVGAIMTVAVALVLVLLIQIGLLDGLTSKSPTAPPEASGAGAPPPGPATLVLDPNHPFADSPAASWPDGAAGIVPPAAAPVGGFTAAQVTDAMRQVREVLTASRLDRRMVVDHDPSAYLGTLAADARRQLEPLFDNGHEAEVQSLVSLAAQGTRLLPVQPKVTGSMSARPGDLPGELVVHTNYVFVYAFNPDALDRIVDLMDILVVVRADVDYVLRTGNRWTPGSQGWWYGAASGYAYSIACDAYHKGYLAPAFTERGAGEASAQERAVYFDPSSPPPPASGCPK
jgi:hypothetical protein